MNIIQRNNFKLDIQYNTIIMDINIHNSGAIMDYIKRTAMQLITETWKANLVAILSGPRQSGKTTLLNHIAEEQKNSGNVVLTVDGDYRSQWDILLNVKKMSQRLEMLPRDKVIYLLIDELQRVERGGIAIKRMFDALGERIRFIATGSVFIWGKAGIGEALTGRALEISLLPFSLSEIFLHKFQSYEIETTGLFDIWTAFHSELVEIWHETIKWGVFPSVYQIIELEKHKKISALADGFTRRDIAEILPKGDWHFFRALMQLLASEPGILNNARISRELARDIKTVSKYIDVAEELFILKRVRPFHSSIRAELRKSQKILFVDCGLMKALADEYPPSLGMTVEQAVGSEIWKAGCPIKYWRTKDGAEVDFIISENIPVEVKSGYRGGRISRGFRSFIDTYKPPVAFWLQPGEPQTVMHNETRIQIMPAPLFVLMLQQNQIPELSITVQVM